jgi:cell division protein FtsB
MDLMKEFPRLMAVLLVVFGYVCGLVVGLVWPKKKKQDDELDKQIESLKMQNEAIQAEIDLIHGNKK